MGNFIAACLVLLTAGIARAEAPAENVIFVTLDGLRWQEVFGGAQSDLLNARSGGVRSEAQTRREFWRDKPDESRALMMPFLWGTVAAQGQIFGDPKHNARAQVTNGMKFSYPGYNEMLTGAPDPRIDSNDKKPNPNVSVLEFLNGKPAFSGRVHVYGSWSVLPFILNVDRSKLPVNADGPPFTKPANDDQRSLNDVAANLPSVWGNDMRFDALTAAGAMDCLKTFKPRVLYVMFGETDEWGHSRRYDLYLGAARQGDHFIRHLWETAQSMPQYAGKTTLIITTDHGRGSSPANWTGHGRDVQGSEYIWIAVMGPGVKPLGVRKNVQVTQSQIAGTIASQVGEDFQTAKKDAAAPLPLK